MPTYKNNGTVARNLYAYGDVAPGTGVQVSKYVSPIHSDFELISHEPRANYPVKLYEDTPPSGTITGLAAYRRLLLSNRTNEALVVAFNEDAENSLSLPPGIMMQVELDKNYDSVSVSGAETGTAGIWACKE